MNLQELKESLSYDITVEEVDRWTEEGNAEDYESDVDYIEYYVYINGTQVGDLTYGDYFGQLTGDLGNRGVDLDMLEQGAEATVKTYLLKSKNGRKHMQLLTKGV